MTESLGVRLRRRREEQAIGLSTITEQTKIKTSLLEALERDDVSNWPSGIFRRAYVRAYALAIGLDPDVVLREFLEVHPEPAEVVETLSAIASAPGRARSDAGAPARFRDILGSAIDSVSRLRRRSAESDAPAADASSPDASLPDAPPRAAHEHATARPSQGPAPAARTVVADHLAPPSPGAPDLAAVARVCTQVARSETADEMERLLADVAGLLDAIGVIVWIWDAAAAQLRPALVHGYSDSVLAQLPPVRRESDNATAAAFRSGQACVVSASGRTSGALVVPLVAGAACAGVLAIELQPGGKRTEWVLAAATIVAAVMGPLVAASPTRSIQFARGLRRLTKERQTP